MSEKKLAAKPKVVRVKKESEVARSEPIDIPKEPPKRKSRAKKQPTKDEALKALNNASTELKQILVDLKEDESKLSGMVLKQVPALLKETLQNLDEDIKEIDEQYNELLSLSAEQPS